MCQCSLDKGLQPSDFAAESIPYAYQGAAKCVKWIKPYHEFHVVKKNNFWLKIISLLLTGVPMSYLGKQRHGIHWLPSISELGSASHCLSPCQLLTLSGAHEHYLSESSSGWLLPALTVSVSILIPMLGRHQHTALPSGLLYTTLWVISYT